MDNLQPRVSFYVLGLVSAAALFNIAGASALATQSSLYARATTLAVSSGRVAGVTTAAVPAARLVGDYDGNNVVTIGEVTKTGGFLNSTNINPADLLIADANGDGQVTQSDVDAASGNFLGKHNCITGAFAPTGVTLVGDFNRDGVVSTQELATANSFVSGAAKPTSDDLKVSDLNGDGRVDQNEASAVSKNINPHPGVCVIVASTLSVAPDTTVPIVTRVPAGVSNKSVAAFKLSARDGDVIVQSITVQKTNSTSCSEANLGLFQNTSQVGITASSLNPNCDVTFSGLALRVPAAGVTLSLQLTLNAAQKDGDQFSYKVTAVAAVSAANPSGSPVSVSGLPVFGPTMTIATEGLTIAQNTSLPFSSQVAPSQKGTPLLNLTITADVSGDVMLQSIKLSSQSAGSKVFNVLAWSNNVAVSSPASFTSDTPNLAIITFNQPLVVTAGSTLGLSIQGDVMNIASGNMSVNLVGVQAVGGSGTSLTNTISGLPVNGRTISIGSTPPTPSKLPDLQVIDVLPISTAATSAGTFTATVVNAGSGDITSPFNVAFQVVNGTTTTAKATTTVSGLRAGARINAQVNLTLTTLGPNAVSATADSDNRVNESVETNNTLTKTVTVTPTFLREGTLTLSPKSSVQLKNGIVAMIDGSNPRSGPAPKINFTLYDSTKNGYPVILNTGDIASQKTWTSPTTLSTVVTITVNSFTHGGTTAADDWTANVTIVSAVRSAVITVGQDSSSPGTYVITAGDKAAEIGRFQLSAASGDVALTGFTVEITGGCTFGVSQLTISDGQTTLASADQFDKNCSKTFTGLSEVIPSGASRTLVVRGSFSQAISNANGNIELTNVQGNFGSIKYNPVNPVKGALVTISPHTGNPSISAISPVAGDVWHGGDSVTIHWSQQNVDFVSLWLMRTSSIRQADIVDSFEVPFGSTTGQYTYTVPTNLPPDTAYTIQFIGYNYGVGSSIVASAPFTIAAGFQVSNVRVTNMTSTSAVVEWDTDVPLLMGVNFAVSPDYVRNGLISGAGAFETSATTHHRVSIAGGVGTWVPGNTLYYQVTYLPGSNAQYALYDGSVYQRTIPADSANLILLSPNGGEVWQVGHSYVVSWNTAGLPTDAHLAMNLINRTPTQNIGSWISVTPSNSGSAAFVVPQNAEAGSQYEMLLSVCASSSFVNGQWTCDNGASGTVGASDRSDQFFTVTDQTSLSGNNQANVLPSTTASTILPTVSVTPTSGSRGTMFVEPGSGFTANALVTLHFRKPDGTEYQPIVKTTDGKGSYANNYTSSSTTPLGVYQYWAVDNTTGIQSNVVNFTIN